MKRLQRRKPPTRLTEQQIITMLITPRAALDRLIGTGRIDYDDLGALQCCYVLAAQIEHQVDRCMANSKVLEGLVQQIESGIPVLQERIERAQAWIDEYAAFLRCVPYDAVHAAISDTQEMCAENMEGAA